MERDISTGLKVWLWIVIVFNGLSAISSLTSIGDSPVSTIISIILDAIMIYACVMIMFQKKKLGFKLMVIFAVINAVVSIVVLVLAGIAAGALLGSAAAGFATALIGIVIAVICAVICPLVTYLLMKKDWDLFA